jgi:hypothetical protein
VPQRAEEAPTATIELLAADERVLGPTRNVMLDGMSKCDRWDPGSSGTGIGPMSSSHPSGITGACCLWVRFAVSMEADRHGDCSPETVSEYLEHECWRPLLR